MPKQIHPRRANKASARPYKRTSKATKSKDDDLRVALDKQFQSIVTARPEAASSAPTEIPTEQSMAELAATLGGL